MYKIFKILLFVVIILFFYSCNKKDSNTYKPQNLIEKKQITNLIAEAYIIEAILYHKSQQNANLKENTVVLYNNLFKKYNTNYKDFMISLEYYFRNEESISDIYSNVITTLIINCQVSQGCLL